jgi:Cu(I)/Ag(I) efflux system membrane fusion protein
MKRIILISLAFVIIGISFGAGFWLRTSYPETVSLKAEPIGSMSKSVSPDSDEDSSLVPGTVEISEANRKRMGVRLETVERKSHKQSIRLLGRVTADETRIYRINAAVEGWIRDVTEVTTGSRVGRDRVLAWFYSPEFLSAQQAYIYALSSMDRFQASGKEPTAQIALTRLNLQQYKDTLRNLGMSDIQIEQIGKTRQYTESIEIRAPAGGFVTFRNITKGLRFEKGTELFRIVDLARVWILADVYENDIGGIRPGTGVKVFLKQQQKIIPARVSGVLPQFDATTRTMKVRLEAENPEFALRPDMFVDLVFPLETSEALTIPAEAVIDSGLRKTVFIESGRDFLQPREIETGRRYGNRVEIVRGLAPGERIVVSGNFLIDAESKMDLDLTGMPGERNCTK